MWSILGFGILGIIVGVLTNLIPLLSSTTLNIIIGVIYFAGLSFYEATQLQILSPLFTPAAIAFNSGYLIGTFGSKLSKQFIGVGI